MHINKNMKGDGHTKYLSSKLSKSYYVIYSVKDAMSLQVVIYIYIYIVYFHAHSRYLVILKAKVFLNCERELCN